MQILYFASIRESLGCESESLSLPASVMTIEDLIDYLIANHGEKWKKALREGEVLVAIDQVMAKKSSTLSDATEVAFFPPVTGG